MESAFNNHINNLIRQLGDYDIKKQETAQQELMSITDNLSKSVVSNPDYNSPELDYLISALEYASKNGCPPGADVMSTVNAAVQIRAEKLYATVKYSGIIHPDLVKLHPEIMTLFQSGEYKKIMDWLSGQTEEIRKKAVQFYKYAVKSTVPVERNEAIKSLIKLGLVKHILPLLHDKSSTIRRETVLVMTNSNDFTLVPYLLPLLKENDYQNSDSIISFVGNSGDKTYIKDLLPRLQHKDDRDKGKAIAAIMKLGGAAIITDIMPLIEDNDYSLSMVARFIEALSDKSDLDSLWPLLQARDNGIQQVAISKIIAWKGQDAAKCLVPLLKDGKSEVRRKVGELLVMKLNSPDKPLINVDDVLPMLNDPDDMVRWYGLCILTQVAGKSAIKHLIPLLKDNTAHIRSTVIHLFVGITDKSLIPEILPLLDDEDKQVRLSAIESLAYLGGDEIIEKYSLMDKLSAIAHEREQHIKFRAIEVAIGIGQGNALEKYGLIKELISLIDYGDEWYKTRSISIAGKYGPASITKKILPFLKNKDLRIKLSAAWALTQHDDIRAVPVWIEHLDDESNVSVIHNSRIGDTGMTSIIYVADEPLRRLTGQTFKKRRNTQLWKDWWSKEGQKWYEDEVKKIKDE